MRHGFATVEVVIGYLRKKVDTLKESDPEKAGEYERQLETLKARVPENGKGLTRRKPRYPLSKEEFTNAKPGDPRVISFLSVGRLFWDRFRAFSDEEQLAFIKQSTGVPEGATKSPIEQAKSLRYLPNKGGQASSEYTSTIKLSGVTFLISSEHSYKYHEQGIDSHPGIAGTQKEVEMAILLQALQRYRAKALPRSGAVGGIAKSTNVVKVNGINIVYLAWSPNPESEMVYIPDYMVQPDK
jgi:hypothetical protein